MMPRGADSGRYPGRGEQGLSLPAVREYRLFLHAFADVRRSGAMPQAMLDRLLAVHDALHDMCWDSLVPDRGSPPEFSMPDLSDLDLDLSDAADDAPGWLDKIRRRSSRDPDSDLDGA